MNNAVLLGFILLIGNASADTGQANCTAPTQREDNTPIQPTEISHFNAYLTDGTPNNYIHTVESKTCSFTLPLLAKPRDVVFTAVDTDGRESVYSQSMALPATGFPPLAPTNITITIQYK